MPRALTTEERQTYLAEGHVGVLAVADEGGRAPLAVPIWYAYQPDGLLTVHTGPESRKARLIDAAGTFSLTVQTETPPYRYVTVSGPVEVREAPSAEERLALAQRYLGEAGGRQFMDQMGAEPEVAFRLRPTRWRTFDYGS